MAGAAPILLLSMPQMMDPNFAKTVVLLTDYTDEGAFGLVGNRPMDQQSAWVLMTEAQGPDEEQREICPGVLLSVSKELTLQVLQSPPSQRARVLVGYAGWQRGRTKSSARS